MNLNYLIWSPYGFATLDYKQKKQQQKKKQTNKTTTEKKQTKNKTKIKLKKNAIRRDHIWKQALRYNTTSLKF